MIAPNDLGQALLGGGVETKSAWMSPCGRYRYDLWRRWGEGDIVLFIGLNPSTADDKIDDPTIKRCIQFAKRWGYGGMCIVNLFAYRATKPENMLAQNDPVGPDNMAAIAAITNRPRVKLIVCAWGGEGGHRGQDKAVCALIAKTGKALFCFQTNKDGSPQHPLYVRGDKPLEPYLWQRSKTTG